MRIGIFTDNDYRKVNGVTTTLRAVVAHAPAGFDVRVYTSEDTAVDRADYLAIRSVGIGIPFYPQMKIYWPRVTAFVRRAARDRLDLIHFTTPGPIGLAAMYAAWRLGLPVVGSFHTDLAEYAAILTGSPRLGRVMHQYLQWTYGKCERILVPSEATRRMLADGGFDARKLEICGRGVSTARFTPARRSRAMRDAWKLGAGDKAIVYVGRLSAEKSVRLLPSLQAMLTRRGLRTRLIVVGGGPLQSELERACPGAVFTGELPHAEVAVAMASSDLFVFPSGTETAGNVVLEAQACGLPVLVADGGGAREQMAPNRTGYVCAGMRQFVECATSLLTNPERLARFRQAAREYACSRTWEAALSPLYRAYREVGARAEPVAAAMGSATPQRA
jgi:glycosyltransferase involved in cell wall biosynthesis